MLKERLPKKYDNLHTVLCFLSDKKHTYKNMYGCDSLWNCHSYFTWSDKEKYFKKLMSKGYVSFKLNMNGPSSCFVKITYKGMWIKYCLENAYYGSF